MIQSLTDNAREPAAEETPRLIARQEHRRAFGSQEIVPANSPDAESKTEHTLQSIAEALSRIGEEILTEPIPPRLLEAILKLSTPKIEI